MSETDRIQVPTNGHRPPLDPTAKPDATVSPDPADAAVAPADPRIVFSPGQVAAGFGILAGLILLIAGGRRRAERG